MSAHQPSCSHGRGWDRVPREPLPAHPPTPSRVPTLFPTMTGPQLREQRQMEERLAALSAHVKHLEDSCLENPMGRGAW